MFHALNCCRRQSRPSARRRHSRLGLAYDGLCLWMDFYQADRAFPTNPAAYMVERGCDPLIRSGWQLDRS